ncbi:YwdI family protein [Ectobacillus ponti]|uniref:YwdI family protein n=1 Tax=Ectobacillus ponti TaxID=2961894 RepID=A0AA41X6C8_9BACI|nr:YwdI family protein [Ectobacillus ponti]MCP8968013.1 YwdI family protein [Ectobacillus ponti]
MQISAEQIVMKMTQELAAAQQEPAKLREHVAAVRALCDLLLEAQPAALPASPVMPAVPQPMFRTMPLPAKEEDGGGSLLDF